jgi:hypothetical protein
VTIPEDAREYACTIVVQVLAVDPAAARDWVTRLLGASARIVSIEPVQQPGPPADGQIEHIPLSPRPGPTYHAEDGSEWLGEPR